MWAAAIRETKEDSRGEKTQSYFDYAGIEFSFVVYRGSPTSFPVAANPLGLVTRAPPLFLDRARSSKGKSSGGMTHAKTRQDRRSLRSM